MERILTIKSNIYALPLYEAPHFFLEMERILTPVEDVGKHI
jgi:hypothetical protein